ncbi:MAG: cytochrome c [Myxococcota bacterium]|nr:cytochrome c [Myxococcota bacterium]
MLRTLLAAVAVLAITLPTAAEAADAEAGKVSFQANCASCHGPEGAGDGPVAVALDPKPRNFAEGDFQYDTDGDGTSGTDADLSDIITQGAAVFGGNAMMAPLPHLSDEEVANIIAFVRTLKQ